MADPKNGRVCTWFAAMAALTMGCASEAIEADEIEAEEVLEAVELGSEAGEAAATGTAHPGVDRLAASSATAPIRCCHGGCSCDGCSCSSGGGCSCSGGSCGAPSCGAP